MWGDFSWRRGCELDKDARIRDFFIDNGYSECDDIDSMSSGSMSLDLEDTWHQGLPMSPQWEGELALDLISASDLSQVTCDKGSEEFDSCTAGDSTGVEGPHGFRQYCSGIFRVGPYPWLTMVTWRLAIAHSWEEVARRVRETTRRLCRPVVLSHDIAGRIHATSLPLRICPQGDRVRKVAGHDCFQLRRERTWLSRRGSWICAN